MYLFLFFYQREYATCTGGFGLRRSAFGHSAKFRRTLLYKHIESESLEKYRCILNTGININTCIKKIEQEYVYSTYNYRSIDFTDM